MKMFDTFIYTNKPESLPNIQLIPVWYEQSGLIPMPTGQVAEYYILDIESLPLYNMELWLLNKQYYIDTINAFKAANPLVQKIGIYGHCPTWNYDDHLNEADRIALNIAKQELANLIDFVSPTLYTHTANMNEWAVWAEEYIEQARQYGLPIYAWMWPEYHENTPGYHGIHPRPIPASDWRFMLDSLKYWQVDGVLFWGGSLQTWDDNAPWYLELQNFIGDNN